MFVRIAFRTGEFVKLADRNIGALVFDYLDFIWFLNAGCRTARTNHIGSAALFPWHTFAGGTTAPRANFCFTAADRFTAVGVDFTFFYILDLSDLRLKV